MEELLKKLSEAPSVSGREEAIGKIIKAELKGHVDEIIEDSFGNIIAKKGKGRVRVMLAAHMDEVGFMVKHIDDKGFIRFAKVGGLDDQILLGQRIIIHSKDKTLPGVIGSKPIHMKKEEEEKQVVKSKEMFIDIGYKTNKEVEKAGVKIGDWISFDRDTIKLGNCIAGKAFDNRAGCAVLIEVLKKAKKKDVELYGVFTTQEETGLKGARVSAFGVDPHLAIAIDTTFGDMPGITPEECNTQVGKGPVICIADGGSESLGGGLITSKKMLDWMETAAKKAKVKCQLNVMGGGTTDAAIISLTRAGVPTANLAVATRYLHTPVQVLDMNDMKGLVKLVESALENLPSV